MKPQYALFALLLLIFSCEKEEDEQPKLKINPEDIELVHGGSEKTWQVVEYYEHHDNGWVDENRDCIADDTYTFRANTTEVEMTMGDNSCYYENPDSQAQLLAFTYYPEDGKAYLDHGRFESKDQFSSGSVYILELEEVSANRLVFASGRDDTWARTLILEAIN